MTHEQLPQRLVEAENMCTTYIRRAMEDPAEARLLSGLLETLSASLWPGVIRAALRTPQDANGKAYRMVDEAIASAIRAGARPEILAELYNSLPRDTVALRETVLEVARQTVWMMKENGGSSRHPAVYLELQNNYVGRLLQMDRIGDAETEGAKAVEYADDPKHSSLPGIAPGRATAYENQAHIMRQTNRAAGAVPLLDAARRIYEELSGQQPETKRTLAICLNNYMAVLTALNRPRDAIRAGRQAAGLFEEMLPAGEPTGAGFVTEGLQAPIDRVWPDYATCLIALAAVLSAAGEHEEALASSTKAVSILAQLTREASDFVPLLGQAQNNAAMSLNELGRFGEAESAVSEALGTFRKLDRLRPGAFDFYLAHCLRRRSFVLAKLGRAQEALAPCREAAALCRKLEKARPGSLTAELKATLDQLKIIRAALRPASASPRRRRGIP